MVSIALLILAGIGLVLLAVAWFFARHLVKWIINSLIGIFALMGWNVLFQGAQLAINIWSVLLVAVGGIFGLIIVVAFHAFGIAF